MSAELSTITGKIGKNVTLEHPVSIAGRVFAGSNIGKMTFINGDTIVYANVTMGRYCSVGKSAEIGVANHPTNFLTTHEFTYGSKWFRNYPEYDKVNKRKFKEAGVKTKIGNDVWIGAKAVIKAGVTIGDGAVIGSCAFVAKDVPPYAIVGGVPAKLIRHRFEPEIVEQLQALQWWDIPFELMSNVRFDNIEQAIADCKAIKKTLAEK